MIKRIINPFSLFFIGMILGVISKLLDNVVGSFYNIIVEQLAYTLSNFTIWVLFGIIISIYSETKKKAMINIFPFCIGILITYYITAEITNAVYGYSFIMFWTIFSFISPIFAFFTWMTKEKGIFPKVISIGILIVTLFVGFVIIKGVSLIDVFIVIPLIIYFLFIKKSRNNK